MAAVAGSSNAREVRDALIHEAMHMIFYTDDLYAGKCYEFWDSGKISDAEKEAWVTFLRDLQYNVVGKRCAAETVLCFFCCYYIRLTLLIFVCMRDNASLCMRFCVCVRVVKTTYRVLNSH